MKSSQGLFALMLFLFAAFIGVDMIYFSKFETRFKTIEREAIVTSNQLATAKIISENLNHVRDLVFRNIEFPGHSDSTSPDHGVFEFLTECSSDLKMRVVSIHPQPPATKGRVTTYGYDIEMTGDFFGFGEFCSKLENSRRIMSMTNFELRMAAGDDKGMDINTSSRHGLRIKMHLNSYRVRK